MPKSSARTLDARRGRKVVARAGQQRRGAPPSPQLAAWREGADGAAREGAPGRRSRGWLDRDRVAVVSMEKPSSLGSVVSERRGCGSGDLPGHPDSSAECGPMPEGKQTLLPPKAGEGTTWKEMRESLWALQTMPAAQTGTGTPMPLAASLTVAERRKQPHFHRWVKG